MQSVADQAPLQISVRLFQLTKLFANAIAALVGFIFLREQLNLKSAIAILLVTFASAGITLFGGSNSK
jgi:threonine/homoserine efflux transporter RhtA